MGYEHILQKAPDGSVPNIGLHCLNGPFPFRPVFENDIYIPLTPASPAVTGGDMMAEGKFKVNPATVEKYLAGVDYPANRQDLLDRARMNDADMNVMDTLDSLPDQTYRSPIDVSKAMAGSETGSRRSSSSGEEVGLAAERETRTARGGGEASVGRTTAVSAAEVQRYLRGMHYPAGISEVVSQAQKNSAPGDVLDILNRIRDREFRSAADLSKALGEVM